MKLFLPDIAIDSYAQLDLVALKKRGIRLLLCDIDNTLACHTDTHCRPEAMKFLRTVQDQGLEVVLFTNNTKKHAYRVLNGGPPMTIHWLCCKPLPFSFWFEMMRHALKPSQVAVMGDQLFTDILGGHLAGAYTILSSPLYEDEPKDTQFMRHLEKPVFARLEKQGKLKRKGKYVQIL